MLRDPHPVRADLLEPGRGEVHHHVGRDVVGRVVHLVQQLLLDRHQVHGAAGARHLGDHGAAVGLHLGDREAEVPRLGHVLEAGIAEVAAGDLRAAFEQVADAVARPEPAWSSGSQPNSCIIGAMKIDGSATRPVTTICAPALQRLDDRLGAQVGLGRDQGRRERRWSAGRSP